VSRLRSLLSSGLVITDGGWGTEFQKRGLPLGEPADLWNLARPGDVEAVARSYVGAGSRVILTNTFRASPVALATCGAAAKTAEINRRGVELSQAAAGESSGVLVFASMGPTGKNLTTGEIDAQTVTDAFTVQAEALAAAGADALLCESFGDLEEARLAVRAARVTGLPVVVSFAFFRGKNKDRTMRGTSPEAVGRAMAEEGVDAVGANCGAGPEVFTPICRRLKDASALPVWIKPNAGLPSLEAGRAIYAMTPEAFASCLPALVEAGASFLGGCCGTSPGFIKALVRAASSQVGRGADSA
jgi:5-methyltetrahydrofolate--homocysteine methyltransferase